MRIKFEELEKLPKNWMFFLRVYSAFAELAQSAGKFATLEAGKEGEGDDLVPEDVSRLAKEAEAYAAKNPFATPFHLPDPFVALVGMVERMRELPRLKCEEGDVEAYRRGNAVALAERCGWFAALTITRLELLCGEDAKMAQMMQAILCLSVKMEEGTAQGKRIEERVAGVERTALDTNAHVEGVPALVEGAKEAWAKPMEGAAEVVKIVESLSPKARELWAAWKNEGSLNKAYAKVGLSYGAAWNLWHDEIAPAFANHGIPDPVKKTKRGRTETISLDRREGWGNDG